MADAGLDDAVVTFNVVGPAKLERLRALLRRIQVTVSVDDARLLPNFGGAVDGSRERGVVVDCDRGLGRRASRLRASGRACG
jgi:D-serine deaminase-like pyridoxal phosphate-dependent protein